MEFEWDAKKAKANLRKHRVSFAEATTALRDPLAKTARDPDHSENEDRYVTFGISTQGRLLVVAHTERGENIRVISARLRLNQNGGSMKKVRPHRSDELRPEYKRSDFGTMVRGKYAQRLAKESNVVVLEPEVAQAFPNDRAVNDTLRSLLRLAKSSGPARRIKKARTIGFRR